MNHIWKNKGLRTLNQVRKPLLYNNLKVGATRFERATSASQTQRSSQAELRPAT